MKYFIPVKDKKVYISDQEGTLKNRADFLHWYGHLFIADSTVSLQKSTANDIVAEPHLRKRYMLLVFVVNLITYLVSGNIIPGLLAGLLFVVVLELDPYIKEVKQAKLFNSEKITTE